MEWKAKLPQETLQKDSQSKGNQVVLGCPPQIKMSDEDMTVVCTIIASAEYCSEVVGALGRSVSKTLEPPYNTQVIPVFPFSPPAQPSKLVV